MFVNFKPKLYFTAGMQTFEERQKELEKQCFLGKGEDMPHTRNGPDCVLRPEKIEELLGIEKVAAPNKRKLCEAGEFEVRPTTSRLNFI